LNVASIKLVASWSINFNISEKFILINVILFLRFGFFIEKVCNILGIWVLGSQLTFTIGDGREEWRKSKVIGVVAFALND